MKSILITGANGVLAKKFTEIHSDRYQIFGAVRQPQNTSELKFNGWEKFNTNVKYDLVLHFAGKYLVDDSLTSKKEVFDAVIGSANSVLDYCASAKTPIIALGSYFEQAPPDCEPWSYYAIAKKATKNLIKLASESHGISARYVYCYDTYGPNTSRGKIVDVLLNDSTKKLDLTPGQQMMNLTHEHDFVSAINLVASEIFDGGSGYEERQIKNPKDEFTLQEIVEIINSRRKTKIDVNFGAKPYREKEAFSVWECAPNVAKWNPQINFSTFVENYMKEKNEK
jgi:CDP-3, 6-dideoxy-D-glycero-L-glycero-4-hexulose-4-reductase